EAFPKAEPNGPKSDNLLTSIVSPWHTICISPGVIATGIQAGAETTSADRPGIGIAPFGMEGAFQDSAPMGMGETSASTACAVRWMNVLESLGLASHTSAGCMVSPLTYGAFVPIGVREEAGSPKTEGPPEPAAELQTNRSDACSHRVIQPSGARGRSVKAAA